MRQAPTEARNGTGGAAMIVVPRLPPAAPARYARPVERSFDGEIVPDRQSMLRVSCVVERFLSDLIARMPLSYRVARETSSPARISRYRIGDIEQENDVAAEKTVASKEASAVDLRQVVAEDKRQLFVKIQKIEAGQEELGSGPDYRAGRSFSR